MDNEPLDHRSLTGVASYIAVHLLGNYPRTAVTQLRANIFAELVRWHTKQGKHGMAACYELIGLQYRHSDLSTDYTPTSLELNLAEGLLIYSYVLGVTLTEDFILDLLINPCKASLCYQFLEKE